MHFARGYGIAVSYTHLNTDSHQVFRAGKAIDLTQREYELLTFLASHPNKVYSRIDLMEQVWNLSLIHI